jgi:hypothetical protein
MEYKEMVKVLANPPGFSLATLMRARDALFELAEEDSDAGRGAQASRDMLTKEINNRK